MRRLCDFRCSRSPRGGGVVIRMFHTRLTGPSLFFLCRRKNREGLCAERTRRRRAEPGNTPKNPIFPV